MNKALQPDMRGRLRVATAEAHERMHGHPGFAAAASGEITPSAYRDLLTRLYGFQAPFEAAAERAPRELRDAIDMAARAKTTLIAADLAALGFAGRLEDLPRCETLPEWGDEAEWLGALYVTEGSTLGGAQIAKALARSPHPETREARRFFLAYGEKRGQMWRSLLDRLETLADDEAADSRSRLAAATTFAAFEAWMR